MASAGNKEIPTWKTVVRGDALPGVGEERLPEVEKWTDGNLRRSLILTESFG